MAVASQKQLNHGGGVVSQLRSYDTFRNLGLIFLNLHVRKEHSTVIFKTT